MNKLLEKNGLFTWKELCLCHKLKFFNHYIFRAKCCRPLIVQTVNSVKSNNLSLKYHRLQISGCKDIGVYIFEIEAKTQFLWGKSINEFMSYDRTKKQINSYIHRLSKVGTFVWSIFNLARLVSTSNLGT